jgi:hypothetical protein
MNSTRRQFFKSAALIALAVALLGSVASASGDERDGPAGSWYYTVTIPGYTFQGIETYSAGGGYTEADQLSFSPFAVASAGHGAWRSMGKNNFLLTYVNLTFDGFNTGAPTGTLRVRQRTTIDRTGNSYTGSGDYSYYDLDGNPLPDISGTFTIVATRILVEAPAN